MKCSSEKSRVLSCFSNAHQPVVLSVVFYRLQCTKSRSDHTLGHRRVRLPMLNAVCFLMVCRYSSVGWYRHSLRATMTESVGVTCIDRIVNPPPFSPARRTLEPQAQPGGHSSRGSCVATHTEHGSTFQNTPENFLNTPIINYFSWPHKRTLLDHSQSTTLNQSLTSLTPKNE